MYKALSLTLAQALRPQLSTRCYHLQGDAKAAVQAIYDQLDAYPLVLHTDVKGYYASIDHDLLRAQVRRHVPEERLCALIEAVMRRIRIRTVCTAR